MVAQIQSPGTEEEWTDFVGTRRRQIARFLSWAAEREAADSLRLSSRADVLRVLSVLNGFNEPWWAAVVYSCFDSVVGTRTVADAFRDPVSGGEAEHLLADIYLTKGAVQHHRTQPGHKGARIALISACARAKDFERILREGHAFHDRYEALRRLNAMQWGRTTCYDLLVRTGQLVIGSAARYQPDRAYLLESSGPRKGFHLILGIEVTRPNADACEAVLRGWGERWPAIADQVGVSWIGEPYGPGDFENALCIFQERGSPGYGRAT